jgi:hypothetical protein
VKQGLLPSNGGYQRRTLAAAEAKVLAALDQFHRCKLNLQRYKKKK